MGVLVACSAFCFLVMLPMPPLFQFAPVNADLRTPPPAGGLTRDPGRFLVGVSPLRWALRIDGTPANDEFFVSLRIPSTDNDGEKRAFADLLEVGGKRPILQPV